MATSYDRIRLKLKICKENGLAAKDIFGASDPYVVIHLVELLAPGTPAPAILQENKIGQTSIKTRTLNPVWNTFLVLRSLYWDRPPSQWCWMCLIGTNWNKTKMVKLIRELQPRSWENVTDTFMIQYAHVSGTIDSELSTSFHLNDDLSVFTRFPGILERFHLSQVLQNFVNGASLENQILKSQMI